MNIKDMLPEQLNAFVAEKVMGWHPKECESNLLEGDDYWQCSVCGLEGDWGDDFDRYSGHIGLPPRYSEDMCAAWEIVRTIAKRYDEQAKYLDRVLEDFTFLLLNDSGGEIYPAYQLLLDMAKWIPMTICHAALRAFNIIDEDGTMKEQEEAS